MTRRALFAFLSIAVAGGCEQPSAPKAVVPRIGYLSSGGCPSDAAGAPDAVLEGLRTRGYVVGQTLALECRVSNQADDQRFRDMARELVEAKVDVIIGISSTATRALTSFAHAIPVVAVDLETDPIASGLAASLARPGGNVTGIFLDAVELSGKRLAVMRELLPALRGVAVLWDASMDPAPLRAAEVAAQAIGLKLETLTIRRPEEFAGALRTAVKKRTGALMVIQSPFMDVHGAEIAALALESRLPAAGLLPTFARQGGLITYGPDVAELFRQLGSFIDRILKGVRPSEMPIERPTRLYLAINLKTAKALGIPVPASLLARADQIIE